MKIIRAANELEADRTKVCLAIGFFDGVHLGHQQIIRQTVTDARQHEALALVVTFDRHPNTIVAPDRVPPLIYSLPQKIRAIASLGADALLLIPFDFPFSQQSGETFVRNLVRDLGPIHSLCVGSNFTFGHRRGGNVDLLRRLGQELNFAVHGLAAVALDGQIISSTRIRETIRSGELDLASQMLGRACSVAGRVIEGDRLGHQLGFPTANLDASGLALPPTGVYAAHVLWRGEKFRAVLNIGFRPTVRDAAPTLRMETHLLEFDRNLYGEEIEVVFLARLREEKRFDSLDELKLQIARDVEQARIGF